MPRFSEDDYLNFIVLEALVQRGERDRKQAEEERKKDEFKGSHKKWNPGES